MSRLFSYGGICLCYLPAVLDKPFNLVQKLTLFLCRKTL